MYICKMDHTLSSDLRKGLVDRASAIITDCIFCSSIRLTALQALRDYVITLDDLSSPDFRNLISKLGPVISVSILKSRDAGVDSRDVGIAVALLTEICIVCPELAEFTIVSFLSLASIDQTSYQFSKESRSEARKGLVRLAQECPEQVKTVVSTLPQSASLALRKELQVSIETM